VMREERRKKKEGGGGGGSALVPEPSTCTCKQLDQSHTRQPSLHTGCMTTRRGTGTRASFIGMSGAGSRKRIILRVSPTRFMLGLPCQCVVIEDLDLSAILGRRSHASWAGHA